MKLSDIGEFGFIDKISKEFKELIPKEVTGIGDDCAVIPVSDEESMLISTDLLIEDIHFLRSEIAPENLGHKSLAVNLSDIAAMGARPIASFLSLSLPGDMNMEWIDCFYQGYKKLSRKYETALLGGDTTRSSQKIAISVTVVGTAPNANICYRSGARPGDVICVTDMLGASAGGLELILRDMDIVTGFMQRLLRKHELPEPNINEGLMLAEGQGVTSMMDISDGLDSDLNHILKASSVGAVINLDRIPVSIDLYEFRDICNDLEPLKLATGGGEDYCLLLTVNDAEFENIALRFRANFGRELYAIGYINNTDGIEYVMDRKTIRYSGNGFNHFKKK